jgi:hypothetical protein
LKKNEDVFNLNKKGGFLPVPKIWGCPLPTSLVKLRLFTKISSLGCLGQIGGSFPSKINWGPFGISSSLVKIRFNSETQPPRLPGSALKVWRFYSQLSWGWGCVGLWHIIITIFMALLWLCMSPFAFNQASRDTRYILFAFFQLYTPLEGTLIKIFWWQKCIPIFLIL